MPPQLAGHLPDVTDTGAVGPICDQLESATEDDAYNVGHHGLWLRRLFATCIALSMGMAGGRVHADDPALHVDERPT